MYSLMGVVGTLVGLSIVVVLSRGTTPPPDPATPEGTVQRYTQALLAGDDAGAAALLDQTSTARQDCQYADTERRAADLRITLGSTLIDGPRSTVSVTLAQGSASGPFGTGEYTSSDAFELQGAYGSWSIVSTPWPLLACSGAEVK
ncbi:hypothetical protein [Paeniglutamicibacter cryotolerans]|uniref:Nuclear transport factor 2 family protein n=1 Tax=Paeniglutamicibacter cryotolerans TaxID=670079 RepID=A0A839QQ28_9MICC|nr:hypothetical protein [Paeniglutamicibacter cryotolerans]MBB2996096.1 hypothetical protein [Paeniglutamicibacter cryotolerans]